MMNFYSRPSIIIEGGIQLYTELHNPIPIDCDTIHFKICYLLLNTRSYCGTVKKDRAEYVPSPPSQCITKDFFAYLEYNDNNNTSNRI